MTDYVSIRDLSVPAVIGVHDWEREVEQTLLFSVDMAADVRKAAASDNLADALDYSAVASAIAAVVRDGRFHLIETAAERVAERLLADFPVTWLRLELRKPITAGAYTAAITIERAMRSPARPQRVRYVRRGRRRRVISPGAGTRRRQRAGEAWPRRHRDACLAQVVRARLRLWPSGRVRSPCMPPSTASAVPVVAPASGLAR